MFNKIHKIIFSRNNILFILIFVGVFLTLYNLISYDQSILTVEIKTKIKQVKDSKNILFKGNKFRGEFISSLDNLGIVNLNFSKVVNVDFENRNILEFRLKEKGNPAWQSINQFSSTLISKEVKFPFGFEPIGNSGNKVYEFEIESLNGNKNNLVILPENLDTVSTTYKLNKNELLRNFPNTLRHFILKVINAPLSYNLLKNIIISFAPVLIFLFLNNFLKNKKGKVKLPLIRQYNLKNKTVVKFLYLFFTIMVFLEILISLHLLSIPFTILALSAIILSLSLVSKSTLPIFIVGICLLLVLSVLNYYGRSEFNELGSEIELVIFALLLISSFNNILRK